MNMLAVVSFIAYNAGFIRNILRLIDFVWCPKIFLFEFSHWFVEHGQFWCKTFLLWFLMMLVIDLMFLRDYPSNPLIGYLNINSIKNKIVQLVNICKTFPMEILCKDKSNLDLCFPNAQVPLPDCQCPAFSEGAQFIRRRKTNLHSYQDNCEKVNCQWNLK